MAYDKSEIYEEAKEAIINQEYLFFVDDLVAYVACSRSSFYSYFPDGSDELDSLKELLKENKINMKVKLRGKLAKGEKAAEILALYKLIATDTERRALSMQHIDHTTKGDKVNVISLGTGSNPNETTT